MSCDAMESLQKHSLWIVPKNTEGDTLQRFIHRLADDYSAPRFVPHLTLVANILTQSGEEYSNVLETSKQLAQATEPFNITFDGFGHTDEEFRCLFLKIAPNESLEALYANTEKLFPQVSDEHFRAMPHLSVLYGDYSLVQKREIIEKHKENQITSTTFSVSSFDLFLTNSPVESWRVESELSFEA